VRFAKKCILQKVTKKIRNLLPQSSPPGFQVPAAKGGNSETKKSVNIKYIYRTCPLGQEKGGEVAFRILYDKQKPERQIRVT
jgi:hypothetical protein